MTAKEVQEEELAAQKVRKVHPCAFRSAKGTVWSERGMTKIRLGTTWQNAAESLPAQPEQETGWTRFERIQGELDAGLAISNDDAKWMLEHAESVESLPVEPKEPDWEKMDYSAKAHGCPCKNCAEPKPTSSTPAEEEAQPLPARVGSVAAYIGITEDQVRRFVGAMNMVGLEIVETSRLSQPASISSEPMPEQLAEVWDWLSKAEFIRSPRSYYRGTPVENSSSEIEKIAYAVASKAEEIRRNQAQVGRS